MSNKTTHVFDNCLPIRVDMLSEKCGEKLTSWGSKNQTIGDPCFPHREIKVQALHKEPLCVDLKTNNLSKMKLRPMERRYIISIHFFNLNLKTYMRYYC